MFFVSRCTTNTKYGVGYTSIRLTMGCVSVDLEVHVSLRAKKAVRVMVKTQRNAVCVSFVCPIRTVVPARPAFKD